MNKKAILTIVSLGLFSACTNVTESDNSVVSNAMLKASSEAIQSCGSSGTWLQVLGSGGPELTDKRASTSYLLWVDGKSRVLIDAGTGSAVNFEKVGAKFTDLDAILLSHLHVDHSADLPAYLKGSFFTQRSNKLLVIGPDGNNRMPDTKTYVERLFKANQGAYQYLGDFLPEPNNTARYTFEPQVYTTPFKSADDVIKYSAASVIHGPIPALAWRLEVAGRSIVFSGDMAKGDANFISLLDSADIFVAHNAIPEGAPAGAKNLHMTPSQIGQFAAQGKVKELLLSHRMSRTLGTEDATLKGVKRSYSESVEFVNDFDCVELL